MLTEQQQNVIVDEWNNRPDDPPSLIELIKIAYPNQPELDGRCKEGKYVQAFLAKKSLKARGAHEYKSKKAPDISDENKQFILNNAKTTILALKLLNDKIELSKYQSIRQQSFYEKIMKKYKNVRISN
jgi:hypothetical protein